MTNEEFLQIIETQYRSIVKPKTYEQLVEAAHANKFDKKAKRIILDEMEMTKNALDILNETEKKQAIIYKNGIEELNEAKQRALISYKKARQKAELKSVKQDSASAEKALTEL